MKYFVAGTFKNKKPLTRQQRLITACAFRKECLGATHVDNMLLDFGEHSVPDSTE